MKYPAGQNITYTAVAKTDGYVSGDHSYLWQFDDSTTAATASTSKAWSTAATHRATVTATNTITGGTDSAFVDVVVRNIGNWVGNGTATPSRPWLSVTYMDGSWYAAGYSGTNIYIGKSSDNGLTWSEIYTFNYTPDAITSVEIASGDGKLLVSIQGSSAIQGVIYSSDLGLTWNPCTGLSGTRAWTGIAYGNGKFVAIARLGGATGQFAYSTNGIAFTTVNSPADRQWSDVTYGNGLFVAISAASTTNGIATSPDGITWTGRNCPTASTWDKVVAGNGIYVASRFSASTQPFMFSTDSITWTLCTAITSTDIRALAYGDGLFVSCASGVTRAFYSTDGNNWVQNAQVNASWQDAAYGVDRFVCVNSNPAGAGNVSQYLDW